MNYLIWAPWASSEDYKPSPVTMSRSGAKCQKGSRPGSLWRAAAGYFLGQTIPTRSPPSPLFLFHRWAARSCRWAASRRIRSILPSSAAISESKVSKSSPLRSQASLTINYSTRTLPRYLRTPSLQVACDDLQLRHLRHSKPAHPRALIYPPPGGRSNI